MYKIYPLTNKRKKQVYSKIFSIKEQIFNISYLRYSLKNIKSLDEIEINTLLNREENKYFKCDFFEKNFAWISKGENGKCRYFSKGYIVYSLDIYDLLSIFFNCKYSQLSTMINEFEPNNTIERIDFKQIRDAESNILSVKQLLETNLDMKKVLSDKIDIYLALTDFCKSNIVIDKNYKGSPVFFISVRYLKEKYELPYSISTINQVINLYHWVGILNKVPEAEIDCDIYKVYSKNKTKAKKVPITFYSMPSIVAYQEDIQMNCSIVNDKNINYYDVKKIKSSIMAEYNIKPVYNSNRGGGQKKKRALSCKEQKKTIESYFEEMMRKNGCVIKEKITEILDLSATVINKKWKTLVSLYDMQSVKPPKKIKEALGLSTNQEIALCKGVKLRDII